MKNKIIIVSTLILLSSITFIIYYIRTIHICKYNDKLDYLNYVSNVEDYYEIEEYRSQTGNYPNSREIVLGSIYSYSERMRIKSLNSSRKILYDPFTDSHLIYSPLIIDNKIIDYIVYSVGPDLNDNNVKAITRFNSGSEDTLKVYFRLPSDSISFWDRLDFDILVRVPYQIINLGRFENLFYSPDSEYKLQKVDFDNWSN